jgi:hypothetical protein
MPIRVLPDDVAIKIAAGEVVERPMSVVKEFIENSIDAVSTEIKIRIEQGGRRLIEVSDNGQGIPAEELPLAIERHATSKIQKADDLSHIHSLGLEGRLYPLLLQYRVLPFNPTQNAKEKVMKFLLLVEKKCHRKLSEYLSVHWLEWRICFLTPRLD